MSFLTFERLSAGYGRAVVLRDVDLAVDEGETVALVGRNGAGKTTLLHSLYGGCAIHGGAILIEGRRLERGPGFAAPRRGVSIAPQGRMILPHLTIRENLLLGSASGRRGAWNLDAVYRLFPVLSERASSSGTALSGGQQQMLAIGRALMANPRVLLLDEPTEGLSPVMVDEIVKTLIDIQRTGTGILLVEQHLSLVRRISSRFVILAKGQVIANGATKDIDSREFREALSF